jgi:hypothetical protein
MASPDKEVNIAATQVDGTDRLLGRSITLMLITEMLYLAETVPYLLIVVLLTGIITLKINKNNHKNVMVNIVMTVIL